MANQNVMNAIAQHIDLEPECFMLLEIDPVEEEVIVAQVQGDEFKVLNILQGDDARHILTELLTPKKGGNVQ